MAGLNISVEMKPADIQAAPDISKEISGSERSGGETFERVLTRAENRSRNEPSTAEKQPDKAVGSEREAREAVKGSEPETSRRKTSDDTVGNEANSRAKAHSETERSSNEPVVKQEGAGETQSVEQTDPSSLHELLAQALSRMTVPQEIIPVLTAQVVNPEQAIAIGPFVKAESIMIAGPTIGPDTSSVTDGPEVAVNVPKDAPLPSPTPVVIDDLKLPELIAVKPDEIGVPIPGPQIRGQQPVVTTVIDEPVPRPAVGSDGSEPSTPVRQSPRSEWTQTLDLARLLNMKSERTEPTVTQPTKPVWRPDTVEVRTGPVTRREVSELTSRPATAKPVIAPQLTSKAVVDVTNSQPAPGRVPILIESGMNLFNSTAATTPAHAIFGNQGVMQQVQTAATAQATVPTPGIDPEALVTDVKGVMLRMSADGSSSVRLTLHPPELGELVVRLESAKNGVMRAEFHTASPLVRESLESGISRLIEALEAEGLTLERAEVQLHMELGAEGETGEQDGIRDGETGSLHDSDGFDRFGSDEIGDAVERLPDGATISVLA